jgi:hypothetical protein
MHKVCKYVWYVDHSYFLFSHICEGSARWMLICKFSLEFELLLPPPTHMHAHIGPKEERLHLWRLIKRMLQINLSLLANDSPWSKQFRASDRLGTPCSTSTYDLPNQMEGHVETPLADQITEFFRGLWLCLLTHVQLTQWSSVYTVTWMPISPSDLDQCTNQDSDYFHIRKASMAVRLGFPCQSDSS